MIYWYKRLAVPFLAAALVMSVNGAGLRVAPELQGIKALGRIGRIDLVWGQGEALFFEIERRDPGAKEFHRINRLLWTTNIYGDFLGKTKGAYAYRVRGVFVSGMRDIALSEWSPIVTATARRGTITGLLTDIQEASFRYFYDFRHPVSGLAREKTPFRKVESVDELTPHYIARIRNLRELCTTGATGMGMYNLIVGVERGFITRKEGLGWALQMLRFLDTKSHHFHGAFSHWLDGATGETYHFAGKEDDGADIVETAFLASGLLVLREYFQGDSRDEREIRRLADSLWRGIEWDWFVTEKSPGGALFWHWSPNYGWEKNHPVRGFNEAQIVYILALASPTHPIQPRSYYKGWLHKNYGHRRTEFGIKLNLGRSLGGPLFFTQYSYLGLDPRAISYEGESYFAHFQKLCRVQVKYAESKADAFKGYGPLWGLTSSSDPNGYARHAPGRSDNGTISPTAAISSMPYLPQESVAAINTMYLKYGKLLWRDFGFTDAFNLSQDWTSEVLIGIDAGPIAPMIENYRSGLCWRTFMHAPEIKRVVNSRK